MRRFLVSYQYTVPRGSGFGTVFHERINGLPSPRDLVAIREHVAARVGIARGEVVILAISEVGAAGEVVT